MVLCALIFIFLSSSRLLLANPIKDRTTLIQHLIDDLTNEFSWITNSSESLQRWWNVGNITLTKELITSLLTKNPIDSTDLNTTRTRAEAIGEDTAELLHEAARSLHDQFFHDNSSFDFDNWSTNVSSLVADLFPSIGTNHTRFRKFYLALAIKLILHRNSRPGTLATWGINHLTPFTKGEMIGTSCGFNSTALPGNLSQVGATTPQSSYPNSYNLLDHGQVGAVQNQQNCGDCYAFSAAGALAGAFMATASNKNNFVYLSPQQITSCSQNYGNNGCNGGTYQSAFVYANAVGGLATSQTYPFSSASGSVAACSSTAASSGVIEPTKLISYASVTSDSAMQAAAFAQPVSIAVEASSSCFQNYRSGVLSPSDCNCGTSIDHAILLTGWGVSNGVQYWIVQNSWGPYWGNAGFIWLARLPSSQNFCGMYTQSAYPLNVGISKSCNVTNPPSYCNPVIISLSPPTPVPPLTPTPSGCVRMELSMGLLLSLLIAFLL